jgi:hypothetical protein
MKSTIEMAREAGVYCTTRQSTLDDMLERFAALVRAQDEALLRQALEWAKANSEAVFAGGGMAAVGGMNAWSAAIKERLG